MKLEEQLKTALDETRMQMLGVQILFGFQFQSVFQSDFAALTRQARIADALALALILFTLSLLIAPAAQHRLVEKGEATLRICRVVRGFANAALLPFALALGCGAYIVLSVEAPRTAIAGGTFTAIAALFFWYGLSMTLRNKSLSKMARPTEEAATSIQTKIEQMLTEARVILPGAQALLGFQFIAVLTNAFRELSAFDRIMHFTALAAIMLTVMLLLAPAAIHRLAFDGRDDDAFHRLGSRIVTIALIPLAAGLSCDSYVALHGMLENSSVAGLGAVLIALLLSILWYGVPLVIRRRLRP
ncbi:MAG TPA: DUF6328 family protein [Micropepsaceae bacterium]|nr:DUF6328 family protein [Micropepsaceae bacterium]